jgi:hypothetical protein
VVLGDATTDSGATQETRVRERLKRIIQFGSRAEAKYGGDIVECADGSELSVIAGAGTHSTPRPVEPGKGEGSSTDEPWTVHDYPGPYEALDVVPYEPVPYTWDEFANDGVYEHIPVELVEDLVEKHGGEA